MNELVTLVITAAMSARYQHLVLQTEHSASPPIREAVLTHSDRGHQVDLRLPRPT